MIDASRPAAGASDRGSFAIDAEAKGDGVLAQLVRCEFTHPPDSVVRADRAFRLELCLNTRHRGSMGCFRDHWSARRQERIGSVFLVPPGVDLYARSDEAYTLRSILIHLDADCIYNLFDKRPRLTDRHLVETLDVRLPRLNALLLRAGDEVRHPGFAGATLLECLSLQMAIELVRFGDRLTDEPRHGGLARWRLRRIDERLAEVTAAPSLPELAKLCGISVRQLARGFRVARGCTVGAYVSSSQIEHAKRLLATDESVACIGQTLGFSTSSNFSYAFRRATGLAPGEFRALLRGH